MSTTDVVRLEDYRGRREKRLRQSLAMYRADPDRSSVVGLLWEALELTGGDRAATVWVDEYGPGLVHVHCILDLASDVPRRTFSREVLQGAWEDGVPGLLDRPDVGGEGRILPGSPRSLAAVALGSDGVRAWFVVADSRTPRPPLSGSVVDAFMFVAGECTSYLLHRDLEASPAGRPTEGNEFERLREERFSGWTVLRDVDERSGDEAANRRITCRFLVTRVLKGLLDDDLAVERDSLLHQVRAVRRELDDAPEADREAQAWHRVLDALEEGDLRKVVGTVLELGERVEWQGHHFGARELHRIGFDLAVALGDVAAAADAARRLGRVCRRMADWSAAEEWYAAGREIARSGELGRAEALIVDGLGNLRRERGDFPGARELYEEALAIGRELDDGRVVGSARQNLMIVEKHAGRTDEAIRHGWAAVQAHESEQRKLATLADLGDIFIRSGALEAAENAFSVVAEQMEKLDIRVIALDALSYIAALRGDEETFRSRVERTEAEPWDDVSPAVRAEVLLFRGRSHLALGRLDDARAALEEAVGLAEAHEINRVLFEAEDLLDDLAKGGAASRDGERELPEPTPETIDRVSGPLARMAGAPAGAWRG